MSAPMVEPSACTWCGIPQRGHARQYADAVGWHAWARPTDAQILARMKARRLALTVARVGALPMPVREEPQEDPVAAGRRLDLLSLMDEHAASVVSPVLAGVLDEAERLRASRWDATKVVAQMESKLLAMHGELTRATERVAELEAERHSTNESLSEAAEQLRVNRDRIAELEAARGLVCRECAAPVRWVENPNGGWWNHMEPASDCHSVVPKPAAVSPTAGYPPALPWARLMDHEDLTDFLDELAASAITHATSEVALTEVEDTIGRWRVIGEAQHAHNTAPGPNAENRTVAYRNTDRPGVLLCREHGDGWAGLTPLTADDLPDGGTCTYGDPAAPDDVCGRDVLIGGA